MSGIIMRLQAHRLDQNLFQHMQELTKLGSSGDMWACNSLVTELVMAHFIRLEDPSAWVQAGQDAANYSQAVQSMTNVLELNPAICELLEMLWSTHFDIAASINSAAFQLMLTHFPAVHPKFILGCAKYLTALLPPGWSLHQDLDSKSLKVQAAIATYLGAVQNLPLDAGHWHELWVAGDEVAVCLIEHFLMHEDQADDRWNKEHVRNPAKYLNRNLQNLRDLVAGNTEVCDMLATLRTVRPDIWAYIDGRAMQRIATCLRGEELLLGCANFLSQSLGSNWQDGRINPRAEVQRCIDAYVNNMFRLYGPQSEGRISPAWKPAPGYVSPAATPRSGGSSASHMMHHPAAFPPSHPSMHAPLSTSFPQATHDHHHTVRSNRFPAPDAHAPTHRHTAPHSSHPGTCASPSGHARQASRQSLTLSIPNGLLHPRHYSNITISPRHSSTPTPRSSSSQIPGPSPNGFPLSPNGINPLMATNDGYPESPISSSSYATLTSPPFTCPPSPSSSSCSYRTSGSEILDLWQVQQGGGKRSIWSPSHMKGLVAGNARDNESALSQAQDWNDRLGALWDGSLSTSPIPQMTY